MIKINVKSVLIQTGLICFLLSGAVGANAFPSNKSLAERNVALMAEGFAFDGGTQVRKDGKLTGNGMEAARIAWSGSGFVVNEDGTIVTNYHVATKALRMVARFDDGSTFKVDKIKVYDPIFDIAILQIHGNKEFKHVTLGDSDKLQPRDKVMAVGNPHGVGLNITEGKISQVVRDKHGDKIVIRHTAPIAPGNSGGALYKGSRVIGVNVRTWTGTQFHQAIPINLVKRLLTPKYKKASLLQEIFSPRKAIKAAKQLASSSGRVPARSSKRAGSSVINWKMYGLTDYLIVVTSPKNTRLSMVLLDNRGKLVGLATKPLADGIQMLALSNQYGRAVRIGILNDSSMPVNYGIKVYQIVW